MLKHGPLLQVSDRGRDMCMVDGYGVRPKNVGNQVFINRCFYSFFPVFHLLKRCGSRSRLRSITAFHPVAMADTMEYQITL